MGGIGKRVSTIRRKTSEYKFDHGGFVTYILGWFKGVRVGLDFAIWLSDDTYQYSDHCLFEVYFSPFYR